MGGEPKWGSEKRERDVEWCVIRHVGVTLQHSGVGKVAR